jgi:hypothetical protein
MIRPFAVGLGALLCATAGAATAQPAPASATALPPIGAEQRAPAPAPTREPAVQRQVLEDDQTRIEELRVRGVNRRLLVQPKIAGVAGYEILPEEPGRDAADRRAAGGQRVWRLLSF